MASGIAGKDIRKLMFGDAAQVSSVSGAFAADTRSVFTVAGGLVLVTSLYGIVTVAMTVANTVKLQSNPTAAADSVDICTATDLGGTTDTAAGTIIGFGQGTTAAPALLRGGQLPPPFLVQVGEIEQVVTGTGPDGDITWYLTYVPFDLGATVIAS